MIPVTKNPQVAKSVYPGTPARHAQVDQARYITQGQHCWFSRGTAHIMLSKRNASLSKWHAITTFRLDIIDAAWKRGVSMGQVLILYHGVT